MGFFKFAFQQKDKGFGRTVLFVLLLILISTISVVVAIAREVSNLNTDSFINEYNSTYNCKIENYVLSCNEDEYDFGNAKIDLNYNDDELEFGYQYILTDTGVVTRQGFLTYDSYFKTLGIEQSNLYVKDAIELIHEVMPVVYIAVIIGCVIGLALFYPIGNLLLALVVRALINSQFKTKFNYQSIYKLTIVTTIPYVLFNALTRMIFGKTLSSMIPFYLITVVIDYAIIYGITYLAVKEGLKDYPKVIESPLVETQDNH